MLVDKGNSSVHGHIVIRDRNTKEILIDKDNAVHFGNFSYAIAKALTGGNPTGHIEFIGFGNGGTQIDATGVINYKEPNVSNLYDPTAALYNVTYRKNVLDNTNPQDNNITVSSETTAGYTDIVVLATLSTNEPAGQDPFDGNGSVEDDFVFDEIALYTRIGDDLSTSDLQKDLLLLTHVMFHPVKKSGNREIEIEYTLRIQVS